MTLLWGFAAKINAAPAADAGALQQNFEKQIEKNKDALEPESVIKNKQPTPTQKNNQDTLVDVKGFKFQGITLITDAEARSALISFSNQKLTLKQLREAANVIVDLYQKKGRIAEAIIPPQDIKDGIVEIKVIEGRVGSLIVAPQFQEDPPRLSSKITSNFLSHYNPEGGFINLDGVERSVSLINEIPGVHAEVFLEPSEKEGATNIRLMVDELSRFSSDISVSNYGPASTGYAQTAANINLRDLAGIGDSGTVNILASQGSIPNINSSQGSIYTQARYYIPIGSDGLRIGVGGSALQYTTLAAFSPTISSGHAFTGGFYGTYALQRNAKSNQTLLFNYENRVYVNYTENTEISDIKINAISFGIQGNRFIDKVLWQYSLNVVNGDLIRRNETDLIADKFSSQTQGFYWKLPFFSKVTIPFSIIENTSLNLSVNGQLASRNLYSGEQMYLGGVNGVRAYPVVQSGGSQGAIFSIDLTHNFTDAINVSAFIDAGSIQQFKFPYANFNTTTHASNFYSLYGAGLEANYNYKKKAAFAATVATPIGTNPLHTSNGEQLNTDNHDRTLQFWLKANYFF
jgi:hemolysin activation/secretion protein